MRRSFRVATVFTGAAALAGGYGPAALAAATQTTAAAAGPVAQVCAANNDGVSHYMHFYYPNDDHPAECFHGLGRTGAGATIASFCPGTYGGVLHGSVSHVGVSLPFGPGQGRHPVSYWDGFRANFHVGSMSVRSKVGSAHCG
jgi:hypothetical protein